MAKYTQAQIDALGKKGHAFKNPDGHFSFPVDDAEDLDNSIKAVGRSGASHDAVRRYLMARARAMGLSSRIPDNWASDGSLKRSITPPSTVNDTHLATKKTCPRCKGKGRVTLTANTPGIKCPLCKGAGKVPGVSADDDSPIGSPVPVNDDRAKAARGELRNVRETRSRPFSEFEARDVPDGYLFSGYASVTEVPYPITDFHGTYQETMARGAFDKTLAEGADVNMLLNHEGLSLARSKSGTLRLSADEKGLLVQAKLDPTNYQVQALRSAVERGDIDEMSLAFRAVRQEWNNDYTERRLLEVNLHQGDVSPCNFGANPATSGLVAMRNRGSRSGDPTGALVVPNYIPYARLLLAKARGREP